MNKSYPKQKQTGMSMIDVMLAIFIFSIGLLGIAGLQMFSKKAGYDAVQRTTAVMLANDIIERMRANSVQATGRDENLNPNLAYITKPGGVSIPGYEPVDPTVIAEPIPDCSDAANACDPGQQAAHDLWEWQQAIAGATDRLSSDDTNTGGLVQPSACITDPTPADPNNDDITVAIVWRSQTPTSNPTSTDCGEATGLYGDNNEFRQVVVVSAIINPDT